jgi:SAM-dependent methyltransferase
MGMMLYDALVIAESTKHLDRCESVLTLGVPTLNFSAKQFSEYSDELSLPSICPDFSDHAGFFRNLGFRDVSAVDISDYEGANYVGDLNDPELAAQIGRQFDLVYDSGTIEHIFNIPTALRTISRLTRLGGICVHATPANGFLDHGFWQVSPDLFRAFYRSAGFSILTSALLVLGESTTAEPAERNFYRSNGRRWVAEKFPEAICVFAAQRVSAVDNAKIDMQDYYQAKHGVSAADYENKFFVKLHVAQPPNWRGRIVIFLQRLMNLVTQK